MHRFVGMRTRRMSVVPEVYYDEQVVIAAATACLRPRPRAFGQRVGAYPVVDRAQPAP